MCQSLWIDNKPVKGVGHLVKIVGRRSIVVDDHYAPAAEFLARCGWGTCLCGINLRATGNKAGYFVHQQTDTQDPMEINWSTRRRRRRP